MIPIIGLMNHKRLKSILQHTGLLLIPGVPQFITLSVFAIIVFFLLSVILNIPEAKKLWNKKKEK